MDIDEIVNLFEYSPNKNHKFSNSELYTIFDELNPSCTYIKIKRELKKLGCEDYRTNDERGLKCIKLK